MSTPYKPSNSRAYKVINPGSGSDAFSTGSDISRVLPRQLSTGSTRGTQTVGYGDTKIDGANNSIRVGSSILLDGNNGVITVEQADGSSVGLGSIPDAYGNVNQFGFFSLNAQGQLISKTVNGNTYVYDPTTSKNVMEYGRLPDGSYGWAVAAPNHDVVEGFS